MKFIKILAGFIVGVILASGITVYATYKYFATDISYTKDGTEISVADALNDLYSKNSNNSNITESLEHKWNSSSTNINYTYNVDESGTYLVGAVTVNKAGTPLTINTNSKIIFEKEISDCVAWGKSMSLKLLKAEKDENIEINADDKYGANAFIYKINNIDISHIQEFSIIQDNTAQVSYTANTDNDKVIVLGFSCGESRSGNITYDGKWLSQEKVGREYLFSICSIK